MRIILKKRYQTKQQDFSSVSATKVGRRKIGGSNLRGKSRYKENDDEDNFVVSEVVKDFIKASKHKDRALVSLITNNLDWENDKFRDEIEDEDEIRQLHFIIKNTMDEVKDVLEEFKTKSNRLILRKR